ncbi:hypothetical protein CAPTEDRAFT_217516 [Capitella teleta]|uniref:Claudin n=1 Tax=Capitella teleta TaxID=283909 RepID=R7UP10_CAPTE|nr:hypothetical protein CAPTEDRAFT_217516 [Capitella teleta]|eukprot:ELU05667.1 hypothetical protein CAPTEDRAFT_217516 [Capitella teleta]
MEPRTAAILVFVGFFIAFVLFLTCFGADYWADTDLLHSGVWKSCIKLTDQCMNTAEALGLTGKEGIAIAIQVLMCLALIVAIAGGAANIFWIVEPDTPKIGIITCACVMVTGGFTGISVALYSMMYSETVNVLAIVTGGGSSMPSGWAYYVALACATLFEFLGIACCCCACQGDSNRRRVQQRPGYNGYHGNPGPYNNRMHGPNNYGGMPPQSIDRGGSMPKTRYTNHHHSDGYPVPMDPTYPPPYSPHRAPPPYE